jgi:hypothetical protein
MERLANRRLLTDIRFPTSVRAFWGTAWWSKQAANAQRPAVDVDIGPPFELFAVWRSSVTAASAPDSMEPAKLAPAKMEPGTATRFRPPNHPTEPAAIPAFRF